MGNRVRERFQLLVGGFEFSVTSLEFFLHLFALGDILALGYGGYYCFTVRSIQVSLIPKDDVYCTILLQNRNFYSFPALTS